MQRKEVKQKGKQKEKNVMNPQITEQCLRKHGGLTKMTTDHKDIPPRDQTIVQNTGTDNKGKEPSARMTADIEVRREDQHDVQFTLKSTWTSKIKRV